MQNLLTKITAGIAGAIALLVAFALAGLGVTVLAFLAMFGVVAVGLAMLAKPFAELSEKTAASEPAQVVKDEPLAA